MQTEAYLTIVIYYHKSFVEKATGVLNLTRIWQLFFLSTQLKITYLRRGV
jgi:hypothetical protein